MFGPTLTWSSGRCLRETAAVIAIVVLASCGASESAEQSAAPATTAKTTTASPPAMERRIPVPTAAPPSVDGTVAAPEWAGAVSASMSDGASVLFMRDEDVLHVAVVGSEIGSVNVVIGSAEEVWILHSSAALGSALYEAGESSWDLVHGFSWCCRSAADSAGPAELFAAERWQANIGFAGEPGVVEYAIALPWQDAAVAISSIRDDTDRGFWPADLSPEAQDQLVGVPPQTRHFSTDEWATLAPAG